MRFSLSRIVHLTHCLLLMDDWIPFFVVQISFSRGKKRYMFDFRFDLKWEAPDLDCGPAKGVLMYPDVGQDCDGVYDVECRVSQHNTTRHNTHTNTEEKSIQPVFLPLTAKDLGTHPLRLLLLYLEREVFLCLYVYFLMKRRAFLVEGLPARLYFY